MNEELRPHPGALSQFTRLWIRTRRMPRLLAYVTRSANWLLLLSVVMIYLMPHSERISTPQLWWWMLAYSLYTLLLELVAIFMRRLYESTMFRVLRVQANLLMVSALV